MLAARRAVPVGNYIAWTVAAREVAYDNGNLLCMRCYVDAVLEPRRDRQGGRFCRRCRAVDDDLVIGINDCDACWQIGVLVRVGAVSGVVCSR